MNLASYGVAGQVLERDLKDQGGRGLFSGQEPEFTFSIFFFCGSQKQRSLVLVDKRTFYRGVTDV